MMTPWEREQFDEMTRGVLLMQTVLSAQTKTLERATNMVHDLSVKLNEARKLASSWNPYRYWTS